MFHGFDGYKRFNIQRIDLKLGLMTIGKRDDKMSQSHNEHSAHALQERFGALRSAVHTLNGEERWSAITALLDDWPLEHLNHVVLPYLEATLAADTSSRRAPDHWLHLAGDKLHAHPAFALARSHHINYRCDLRYLDLDTLSSSPQMARITHAPSRG